MSVTPFKGIRGPAIRALDNWGVGGSTHGKMHQLLSDEERARLATIASIVRFEKGTEIYREGDQAEALFNIIGGVVKAYKRNPDGSEHILAFWFPQDLFGLSEDSRYVSSIKTLTPVTAYRIPLSALRSRLSSDPLLEFHLIVKLCYELRQAQRHAFMLARTRTIPKLTMFLQMLEEMQAANAEPTNEIYLPMNRSDIAEYVGTSLAAVSRAFHALAAKGILQTRNRKHVKIIDRAAFDKLAGNVVDGGQLSARENPIN
jgi:CRP-like cAMP-binding protein